MYSKVNYTIVGIFVLIFGVGMVWFAFWLAKYGLDEEYDVYRLEMKESVAGLSIDSNVKLHGVNIGRVVKIQINPKDIETVEVLVEIQKGIPIKEDMIAFTEMFGVTGLLSINIEGGSNGAKTLVPTKDHIPEIKTKPSLLTKLTYNLGGMSDKIEALLIQSEKLFSDRNVETMGHILENVEKITAKGEALEDQMMASMKHINAKLTEAAEDFKQMQKDFAEIKEASVSAIDSLTAASKNFNRVTRKAEQSLERGDYNLKKILEPALIEMQILTNQLTTMSRQLEQNPTELLFKSRQLRKGPGE